MTKHPLIWLIGLCCATAGYAEPRSIHVTLRAPDSAWTLVIEEIHAVNEELWVIARVARDPETMGLQVISTLRASVTLTAPDVPTKVLVIGKTWGWKNPEPYTFIANRREIDAALSAGRQLYRRMDRIPPADTP